MSLADAPLLSFLIFLFLSIFQTFWWTCLRVHTCDCLSWSITYICCCINMGRIRFLGHFCNFLLIFQGWGAYVCKISTLRNCDNTIFTGQSNTYGIHKHSVSISNVLHYYDINLEATTMYNKKNQKASCLSFGHWRS